MLKTLKRRLDRSFNQLLLSPAAKDIIRQRLTYLSERRLLHIEQELERISREAVPGAFLEFGVALGGSAILISKHLQGQRDFHGFDVFGMIPPPTSDKDDEKSKARYETIRSGQSKGLAGDQYYGYRDDLYDQVCSSFEDNDMPVGRAPVFLHKGLFQDTWPAVAGDIDRIAFAHIDCDWYDPVKFCLDSISRKMSVGGSIVIDDFNDYGGCQTATSEFLDSHRYFKVVRNSENLIIRRLGE